jgi:transcriptional regulator with XRE-family HTH domain
VIRTRGTIAAVPQPPNVGPALLKRRLGEELRKLRDAAGITVPQAAAELGSSEAKVRHMENGRNVPSKPDLTVLMALYDAPADIRGDLEELRQAAGKRAWSSSYRLPTWLQNLYDMETDATMIRAFELELIPGLLQIEPYANVLHSFGPTVVDPKDADLLVTARLKRQEILTREKPVNFRAVISEAALHRLRDNEFAVDQCRHLLAMAKRPNIGISILPFAKRLHQSMSSGFTLLSFPDDTYAPVAYVDYAFGGQMEHESKKVTRLSEIYEELATKALGAKESAAFIGDWIKGEKS